MMKIDTRKLRKILNKMIAELDAMPKVTKEFGGDLRDICYGIGTVGNYVVSLELVEFDCPASEFAHHTDVISGDRDDQPRETTIKPISER